MSKEVYKKALDLYGLKPQLRQLQEECAELIVAVNHYIRGRIKEEEFISEIADVKNMIRQFEEFFGEDRVNEECEYKLERLMMRMELYEQEKVREQNV